MKLKVKKTKLVSYEKQLQKQMADAYDAALFQIATDIMTVSQEQCPIELGNLRRSGYVSPPRNHAVKLGYGMNYALAVHERHEAWHQPPTKWRYLKDPIDAAKSTWQKDFAEKLQSNLDSGAKWGGGQFPTSPDI